MSWLDNLLLACEEAETPVSWNYWAGIASISAVVSPNVWINRKFYKLSPNVFIMLIGESGIGKGFPIYVSKKLVNLSGATRVISGRNTIQSILKELGSTSSDEKTGVPKFKDARGFVVSGEFSTLLQEDKAALPILTDLYDKHYNENWDNSTKGSGIDKLVSPSVTLFGGSTPEHFSNVVPDSDVKGGFVGRILTSYAEERSKINPLSDTEADNNFPFNDLVEHLRLISLVKGPFKYGPGARAEWDEWYYAIRTKKVHDPTGAVNRLPDNVLKVAMCLSLADGVSLEISLCNLRESIDKCMNLTIDSRRLTEGKGASELGAPTKLVIYTLYKAPDYEMAKSKLLQQHYGQFDVYALDRIIQTLETAGMIQSYLKDRQTILKMLPEAVLSITKFMER